MTNGTNGWSRYEEMVLFRLSQLETELRAVRGDIQGLKLKSGIWGALAGLIVPVLAVLYAVFTGRALPQ